MKYDIQILFKNFFISWSVVGLQPLHNDRQIINFVLLSFKADNV